MDGERGRGADLPDSPGAWAPRGTPRAVVDRLSAEILKALEQGKVKDVLTSVSAVPGTMTPRQYGAYLAAEVKVWGDVVKAENLKM